MTTFTSDDREEAYKKIVEAAPNQPGYEDAVPISPANQKAQAERNNEPVAWMYEKPSGASKLSFVQEKMLWDDMKETPLYTHPVKELTDEEITKLHLECWDEIEFARAILRKAQEK